MAMFYIRLMYCGPGRMATLNYLHAVLHVLLLALVNHVIMSLSTVHCTAEISILTEI